MQWFCRRDCPPDWHRTPKCFGCKFGAVAHTGNPAHTLRCSCDISTELAQGVDLVDVKVCLEVPVGCKAEVQQDGLHMFLG
jgi:hypothetical protein